MSPPAQTYLPLSDGELVFGLVYGTGTELETFQRLMRERLQHHGYVLRPIHLSDYFPAILGKEDFKRESPDAVRALQEMGDQLRAQAGSNAILAHLSAYLIGATRARDGAEDRTAWLLQSFKRPEEIELLRRIYGPRFILLGIHVPEPLRHRSQAHRWQRWASVTSRRFEEEATTDIRRDEHDPVAAYGQALRRTFAESDFFIDARTDARLKETLPRAIRLVFGEPFEPPVRDEQAMYHAFTAGLRSAEMGRQVGAAVVNSDGDVLTVGANEVPSGRGGLYWSPDQPDGRDFAQQPPLDSNSLWQRRIARELLVRMAESEWANRSRFSRVSSTFDVTEDDLDGFLRTVQGTRFSDITEFGRAVHAEMDALTTAARDGVSVRDATLVCTTFPCHGCARHIIASGIRRVVFIYPYTKSLARDLHEDATLFEPEELGPVKDKVVFEQFIGVAPRCYAQYFSFGPSSRKDPRGRGMKAVEPRVATARVLEDGGPFMFGGPAVPATAVSRLEKAAAREFEQLAKRRDLMIPVPHTEEDIS
jgi:cytidine deaminase